MEKWVGPTTREDRAPISSLGEDELDPRGPQEEDEEDSEPEDVEEEEGAPEGA